MSDARASPLGRLLAFAAVVEAGTGLVLLADPALVSGLLLGGAVSGAGSAVARCFGIALIGLGMACWPGATRAAGLASAHRAMLTYNALVALYLATLALVERMTGPLLWPAVVLHAAVALGLVWAGRRARWSRGGRPIDAAGGW